MMRLYTTIAEKAGSLYQNIIGAFKRPSIVMVRDPLESPEESAFPTRFGEAVNRIYQNNQRQHR